MSYDFFVGFIFIECAEAVATDDIHYHFRHRSVVVHIDFESIHCAWKAKGSLSLNCIVVISRRTTALNLFDFFERGVWVIMLSVLSSSLKYTIEWALHKCVCQWIVMSSFSFLFHSCVFHMRTISLNQQESCLSCHLHCLSILISTFSLFFCVCVSRLPPVTATRGQRGNIDSSNQISRSIHLSSVHFFSIYRLTHTKWTSKVWTAKGNTISKNKWKMQMRSFKAVTHTHTIDSIPESIGFLSSQYRLIVIISIGFSLQIPRWFFIN